MSTVTLIGTRLADVGQTFQYHGETPACEGCPFRDQCLNLDQGTHYRVTDIRENAQVLECAVHDTGVRAVEVEPAPVTANIPSRDAYTGSRTKLAGTCPYTSCPSHEYCEPEGATLGEPYRIAEVLGDPPHEFCQLDRELTLVKLEEL